MYTVDNERDSSKHLFLFAGIWWTAVLLKNCSRFLKEELSNGTWCKSPCLDPGIRKLIIYRFFL